MADPPPTITTPKRKRGGDAPGPGSSPIKFSFEHAAGSPADGPSTPRSKTAHRFRGLALGSPVARDSKETDEQRQGGKGADGGGGVDVGVGHDDDEDFVTTDTMRKRQKADLDMTDATHSAPNSHASFGTQRGIPWGTAGSSSRSGAAFDMRHSIEGVASEHPSLDLLPPLEPPSKQRPRKRSGTPPLRLRKGPIPDLGDEDDEDGDEEMEIVDPVRAALTWHDHEITVYDPEDEDDDGTGINGIGFKPTPALAHARAMKRRQQMAEYRRREDSDARERRNQRRRGAAVEETVLMAGTEDVEKSPERKVRFMEAERQNIAITSG